MTPFYISDFFLKLGNGTTSFFCNINTECRSYFSTVTYQNGIPEQFSSAEQICPLQLRL